MAEFTIDGVLYTSGLLDGSVQMKLAKRLTPIFTAIIGQASAIQAASAANESDTKAIEDAGSGLAEDAVAAIRKGMSDRMATAVMPISRELAALSDEAEDFIVNACLSVTQWREPTGRPFPVRDADGTIGHMRNRSLAVRLRVTMNVLADNFSEMFAGFGVDIQKLMLSAGDKK